jgi:hypothetical protein
MIRSQYGSPKDYFLYSTHRGMVVHDHASNTIFMGFQGRYSAGFLVLEFFGEYKI